MRRGHTLIEGDCRDAFRDIATGSVDLILWDPPYGQTQNAWDSLVSSETMFGEGFRVLRPEGNLVMFAAQAFSVRVAAAALDKFKYKMVWVKNQASNHLNAKIQPMRKHEDILVFGEGRTKYNQVLLPGEPYHVTASPSKARTRSSNYGVHAMPEFKNEGTRVPDDVLFFDRVPKRTKNQHRHPTQKPLDLCEYLIRLFTDPSDLVLDPTMGSGTTVVAAVRTGRRAIGVERDPEWFAHAQQRVVEAEVEAIL